MTARRQAGFTLLEVLVALVVLGLLLGGLSQGVRFGLRAWNSQARTLETRADFDAVDRVLRRLIENADPGRATIAAQITGQRTALSLVTELSAEDGPSTLHLVEAAIGVNGARRLVLRVSPYLHAVRLLPVPAPETAVLLEGVLRLDIAYWGRAPGTSNAAGPSGADAPRSWRTSWQGPQLPDLIRIEVVLPPGDTRRWPPIVAAPMRAKPD